MENLIKFNNENINLSKLDNSVFYDRLYFSLKEDGFNVSYGDFCSRILKNGCISVLKSLGLYLVKGARSNKVTYIHEKLELIINTTIADSKSIALSIIKLYDGEYANINKFNILDLSKFMSLSSDYPHSIDASKCTYIIYNKYNKLYKIGRSSNIYDRLNNLRREISPELDIVAYFNKDLEGVLHKEYNQYREFGEWFSLNNDDILDIKNKYSFEILFLPERN